MKKIIKKIKDTNKVVEIKSCKKDAGGEFYIYDIYDHNNNIMELNRYVYKDSSKQPFDKLTVEEEDILNPVIEESTMEKMI